eukprot:jgi/Ulvmu1/9150/UM005_0248.1
MGPFKAQDGLHETFLPTIPKSSPHARHASQQGSDGRLLSQGRQSISAHDTTEKEMAALQRNYESMSLTVQMSRKELSKAQAEVQAERDARQTLESRLSESAANLAHLTAELEQARVAAKESSRLDDRLSHCTAQREQLQANLDHMSQETISLAHKLEVEQQQNAKLKQGEQRQTAAHLSLQKRLDEAIRTQSALQKENEGAATELHGMQQLLSNISGRIMELQTEKEQLQASSQEERAKLEGVMEQLQRLKAAVTSHDAATKAMEAQLESAHERGTLLQRQLGMKTADWEVALEQLGQARKEAAEHEAAQAHSADELAKARKQASLLTAEVAALAERLDGARAAGASSNEDLQGALTELTTTRALLAEAQREAQAMQQAAALELQRHRAELKVVERRMVEGREQAAQDRRMWAQGARDQLALLDSTEKRAVTMAEKLHEILHRHEASMAAVGQDVQQQVACWMSSICHIQSAQSKALACAGSWGRQSQVELGSRMSCMQHASMEQVAMWQQRASKAEAQLAKQSDEHETAMAQLSRRHSHALKEQYDSLAAKVQALQGSLDELKATSDADGSAWSQRMQSEMARQRQQNETIRVQMQDEARQLKHERDVAHGQLTVLSTQHQAKMRQLEQEHQSKLDAALGQAASLEQQMSELGTGLAGALACAKCAEAALADAKQLPKGTRPLESYPAVEAAAAATTAAVSRAELLQQLAASVTRISEACQQASPHAPQPPAPVSTKLVFPEFSEQEKSLRATLDKLVQAEASLECNYTCLRCVAVFEDPVACVPCGHCYCRACWQQQAVAGGAGGPRCQECHQRVERVIPAGNLDRLASKFEFKLRALTAIQRMCEGTIVAEGT